MACCVLGAFLIAQCLLLIRRLKEAWRTAWLLASIVLGIGLLSFGATQMAFATEPGIALTAWCSAFVPVGDGAAQTAPTRMSQ